jgi:hypothetical protein
MASRSVFFNPNFSHFFPTQKLGIVLRENFIFVERKIWLISVIFLDFFLSNYAKGGAGWVGTQDEDNFGL